MVDHTNLKEEVSRLRIRASKKKVLASKHYLKYRALQKKSCLATLRITEFQDEIDELLERKRFFESKAKDLEHRFAGQNNLKIAKGEIESRKRKAVEQLEKAMVIEKKMKEEKKKIVEYAEKAKEFFKKRTEAMKEYSELEMEAAELEIKFGIKK